MTAWNLSVPISVWPELPSSWHRSNLASDFMRIVRFIGKVLRFVILTIFPTSSLQTMWRLWRVIGDVRKPKTKPDLIKSISSLPKIEFEVIEMGSQRDKQNVIRPLDRMVSKGPVSVIIIRETWPWWHFRNFWLNETSHERVRLPSLRSNRNSMVIDHNRTFRLRGHTSHQNWQMRPPINVSNGSRRSWTNYCREWSTREDRSDPMLGSRPRVTCSHPIYWRNETGTEDERGFFNPIGIDLTKPNKSNSFRIRKLGSFKKC